MRVCAVPLEPSRQPARKKEFFGVLEAERRDRKNFKLQLPGPSARRRPPRTAGGTRQRGQRRSLPRRSRGVLPQSNMFDEMGDQLIDFEGQRKKDSPSDDQPPEEEGEFTAHDESGGFYRTSWGAIETEDEKKNSDDRQGHEDEIDGVNHELVRLNLLPAHSPKPFDEAAYQADRCRTRLQGRNEEKHGQHGIVPEGPGDQNSRINSHQKRDWNSCQPHPPADSIQVLPGQPLK